MIRHAKVRSRKLVQNGTITNPSSIPRHRGLTRVARKYAIGKAMRRHRVVPMIATRTDDQNVETKASLNVAR